MAPAAMIMAEPIKTAQVVKCTGKVQILKKKKKETDKRDKYSELQSTPVIII